MTDKITRVLGFDFGMKRIGVAIGQLVTRTASPLTILPAKQGEPDWTAVKKLVQQWSPQALVVGIPLNMDGSEQVMTEHARVFCQKLTARYALPIFEVDERLSTRTVREQLFLEKGFRGVKQQRFDALAAQLIVEDWLKAY